jgi:hypothetical protein
MIKSKNIILSKNTLFVFILCFLICNSVGAQSEIMFLHNENFSIPNSNGAFSFVAGGSYENASLKDGVWSFTNLYLDNSGWIENLKVSARDSNLIITSVQTFIDETFAALLSYTVIEDGSQSFDLGIDSLRGVWSVSFEDVFIAENDGWSLASDNTITITGASENVTIFYFIFPDQPGTGLDNLTSSIYSLHSVLILTAVIVVATLIIATIINKRKQKSSLP